MKRKSEQSSENTEDGTKNREKSSKLDLESSNKNQAAESGDEAASVEAHEKVGTGAVRKKKGRTSYVWNNFSIRLGSDEKTEFAHCNYCARYVPTKSFRFLVHFFHYILN